MQNADKLEKLKNILELLKTDTINPKQMKDIIAVLTNAVANALKEVKNISAEGQKSLQDTISYLESENSKLQNSLTASTDTKISNIESLAQESIDKVNTALTEIKSIVVLDGQDADEEKIITEVLTRIKLPEYKEVILDDGEKIVAKINDLNTIPDNQIDAKHIKNLPIYLGKSGGVVAHNIYQLGDVSLTNLANNDTLVWDNTNKFWKNAAGSGGGTVGPGTINEIAYFNSATTVASLATVTYPTLTELSYTKGLSSSAQTQITARLPLAGGTMTGALVLATGSTTVAPIKMVAGINLTTPVAGVIEFDGTDFFISV